jgi:hypothetical protein
MRWPRDRSDSAERLSIELPFGQRGAGTEKARREQEEVVDAEDVERTGAAVRSWRWLVSFPEMRRGPRSIRHFCVLLAVPNGKENVASHTNKMSGVSSSCPIVDRAFRLLP